MDALIGTGAEKAIKDVKNGDIIMLENSRFYSEEVVVKDDITSFQLRELETPVQIRTDPYWTV